VSRDEPPEFRFLPDSDEPELPADPALEPGFGIGIGLSRRGKLLIGLLAAALALTGGGLQLSRARHAAEQARSAHPVQTAPPAVTADGQQAVESAADWPHAKVGVCGGPGALLPILTSKPLAEPTGVRLTVGSFGIRTVDLDTGLVSATPQVALRDGNVVQDRRTLGSTSYLLVGSCGGTNRVLSYAPGRAAINLSSNLAAEQLFGNSADGVWMATFSKIELSSAALQVQLVRLDQPAAVLLPPDSFPVAFSGHRVLCELLSPNGMELTRLVVFDTALHRVVRDLGPEASFTSSQTEVLWTSQLCSAATTCRVHTYDVRTGITTVRDYALPVEAGLNGGVLSPDGRRLAFQLPRMAPDPRYTTQLPGGPSDLVVLDLQTGVLEPVPNLELPPGSTVGLTFSSDSRWLVTAVTGEDGSQLLAWRSGLTQPLASPARLPGPMADPVPFLAVPTPRT
jgi:hypothetical protein